MNRSMFAIAAALLMLSCASEDRSHLQRRPLEPAGQNGWARVRLDGEAQRARQGLWIGDAEGNSIPFLLEREGLWAPQVLETTRYLTGKDVQGNPTAEFALVFPNGWQVREREQLRLDLDLEGKSPWVARVDISRRMANGGFLTLERDSPFFVYDLSNDRHTSQITLPWDAERYRVTLVATQGKAPKLNGLRVTASTWPEQLEADEVAVPQVAKEISKGTDEFLRLDLPNAERVVAADVLLKSPVAPVYVTLDAEEKDGDGPKRPALRSMGGGTVWNLPALETRATRVALDPTITGRMRLHIPENTTLESVKLLVRHEALLFPAEAGKPYFLHLGGCAKQAPGNLGALPASRQIYGRNPLKLMSAEPDPQGLGLILDKGDQTRPWLPWAVGLVVLLLGFAAFKLLRSSEG
ncbi:MAG: hypothetical protein IPP78_05145 [Holophagaceae bacterium]|nr:hypothetical protein [Holophagaceae bacterium]